MTSFGLVFFFAITGITLNHPDWWPGTERTRQLTGRVDPAWLAPGNPDVARLDIVEFLRRSHGIAGAVGDVRVDEDQVALTFKGPGYSADAFVDRRAATYELTETRLGLVAIMNDLHKGRDTGGVWQFIIDLSAGLLAFVSLSGLVLLYFIHKHRFAGFVLLALGTLASYGAYLAWVP